MNDINIEEERLSKIIISKEVLDNDLKFLHEWLQDQLKNKETKEFWNKTLGETVKRIKSKE